MTITHFERNAATLSSRFLSTLTAFLQRIHEWHRHHRALKNDRAAFMQMLRLDDSMLNDIGVTREDVAWAASLPLDVNAARAVRERAKLCPIAAAKQGSNPGSASHSKTDRASALEHLPSVVAARWLYFRQGSNID